jgi:hypothetical protein
LCKLYVDTGRARGVDEGHPTMGERHRDVRGAWA